MPWELPGPHFGGLGGASGPHFGGLGRPCGHGLDPELSQGRQNELNCTPVQAGASISEPPGIHNTAKVQGGIVDFGSYCNPTTDCQDDRRSSRRAEDKMN